MDKNQVVGILLIIALVIVWQVYFMPDEQPIQEDAITPQEQVENADSQSDQKPAVIPQQDPVISQEPDSARIAVLNDLLTEEHGIFAPAAQGDSKEVILENNKVRVVLDTHGGLIKTVTLEDGHISLRDSSKIEFWDPELSAMRLNFLYHDKGLASTEDYYFAASTDHSVATESQPGNVVMTMPTNNSNQSIEIVYTLNHDAYDVNCSIRFNGLSREIDLTGNKPMLNWEAVGWANERGIEEERRRSSVFFREFGQDRDYLREATESEEELEDPLHWMAFKEDFFTAAVINEKGFSKGSFIYSSPAADEDSVHSAIYKAVLPMEMTTGPEATAELRFFFGPNESKTLKNLQVEEFTRIIDYGWWIFGWVNRQLIRPVFNWLNSFIPSYGLVIIILTILIKMLLFPVTWKNYLSSAKMRVLKPDIDEINKKYEGKDAMEKQQAVMSLYRQTGVNPFAGCIPVLLQMPILYAMFRFFPASIELRGQGFLWAEDLGSYDSIWDLGFNIPFYGDHVSGFTLLMAASTFFYTRMNMSNMPTQSQPGMPNMKIIMNFFPFMMLFFFNNFASGLSFYYFIANVISIGQMVAIKKYFIDEDKIHAKIEKNKKVPKKKSGFQARLEEMQKVQKANVKKK